VLVSALLILVSLVVGSEAERDNRYFYIKVVDQETDRGVPLVELKTVNGIRLYTDSAGVAAFYEPGLMGKQVYFHVSSHGYEYAKDGFNYRGVRVDAKAGESITLKIKRINIAERLYRVTGAGAYRDSILAGESPPVKSPLLNGLVLGSDSVVTAKYRDKIYWFWGDTNRPSYPLGNFHVSGATSELPSNGGLDPAVGVDLNYFVDNYFVDDRGFAKATAKMPGDGPTWIDALTVVKDAAGVERLFAKYVKIKPPLEVYQRGLVEFDDEAKLFRKVASFESDSHVLPAGHPIRVTKDDADYIYFGNAYPFVRVKANVEDLLALSSYEAYSPFTSGSRSDEIGLDRGSDGTLNYSWKLNTIVATPKLLDRLIREGRMKSDESCFRMRDIETGKRVQVHRSSVAWNSYRQRWTMIFCEHFGSSLLGEIWFSESKQLEGPWLHARKIVTHDKYSFYNPRHHPMLDQTGGRLIYFEGTYTNTFSGNPDQTPRYDYNQIMYRLDLSEPRLTFPEPRR
jgi:hypothetical protein